jgi:hypothetical protein
MLEVITERFGLAPDTLLNRRSTARAVTTLDLVYCTACFFDRPGKPRFQCAVSAVIEAHGVQRESAEAASPIGYIISSTPKRPAAGSGHRARALTS